MARRIHQTGVELPKLTGDLIAVSNTYLETVNPVSLVDKYRPRELSDLVLPDQHGLAASLRFCDAPYPSAWLLHGKPGLGKSSLAGIMARRASHPLAIRSYSGADLTVDAVRQIVDAVVYRPMYGDLHTVVVEEADSI